ncbi:MAG: glycosyltransferase [Alphaproteobacteria bacterium]
MTRILQVIAGAHHGGAETFFVDLVTALHGSGVEQRVVMRRNPARAEILRQAGIEPVELAFGGLFDLGTRRAIKREIAAWKPDIVQSWMNRATRHCPRGEFIHVGWLGGYYKPRNYRRCDHVVGVTPGIVDHLKTNGGWPDDRAHFLPTLAVDEPAVPLARSTFDTPEDAALLLALGRLHWKKAFDVLLKAVAEVEEVNLWIAGDGPLEDDLKRLCRELGLDGRVRFLGWRDDREAMLKAADICIMPSRYEPFGTVMVEAWAQKVPVITTSCAGPLEFIKHDKNGLLVPIDDVAALAQAIRRLMTDKEVFARLAEGGHADYQAQFSKPRVVELWREFLAGIVS